MGMPQLLDDWLFLAPMVRDQLAAQVPGVPVEVVETVEDLMAADKRAQVLMVLYAGYRPSDVAARSSVQVQQRWLVCLGLNNAGAGAARASQAGPLMSRAMKALHGWRWHPGAQPMRLATPPLGPRIDKTKALFPMGFEVALAL